MMDFKFLYKYITSSVINLLNIVYYDYFIIINNTLISYNYHYNIGAGYGISIQNFNKNYVMAYHLDSTNNILLLLNEYTYEKFHFNKIKTYIEHNNLCIWESMYGTFNIYINLLTYCIYFTKGSNFYIYDKANNINIRSKMLFLVEDCFHLIDENDKHYLLNRNSLLNLEEDCRERGDSNFIAMSISHRYSYYSKLKENKIIKIKLIDIE